MGGWRDDPSPAPSPGARHARRTHAPRPPGSSAPAGSWRDLIRPVKDAAAKGRGEDDALGVATARFLERARSAGDGFPSLGDAPASEVTGDVVLLARAVNRPGAPPSPDADPASASASPAASAFDALLADLLAAQKLALDAETVAALAAFYRARLASAAEVTPAARVDECLKVIAQLLQEGGAHILPSEVDVLLPALLAKVAQTRTRRGGNGNERPSYSSASSSSSADADASDPAERPSRDKETSRHALNAIGALVSRSPAGAVAEAARVAVGEALVAALDDAALEARREGSQSQVSQFRKSARGGFALDAVSSRYLAAVARCAHLCAAPDGAGGALAPWPDRVVAPLVAHLRSLLSYGVGDESKGGGERERERERERVAPPSSASSDASSAPPPPSPSRGGGYVPPHLRGLGAKMTVVGASGDSSDSDCASEYASDSSDRSRLRARHSDRHGASRARAAAAACVAALARSSPRSLHASWPALLPTSVGQLLPRSPSHTLARVFLSDPSPRVRGAAFLATAALFDARESRAFFAAAEARASDPRTGRVMRRAHFASLSSTLGDVAVTTHGALVRAVAAEPDVGLLPAACKALAAFIDAAPHGRMPEETLEKTVAAIWARLEGVLKESSEGGGEPLGAEGNKPLGEQREGDGAGAEEREGGPQGSRWTRESEGGVAAKEPWGQRADRGLASAAETSAARTSLLAALGAALGASDAPPRFGAALARGDDDRDEAAAEDPPPRGNSRVSSSGSSSSFSSSLRSVLPGLFAVAGDPSGRFGAATRCEAFGALRSAAERRADALATFWRFPPDAAFVAALPASVVSRSSRGLASIEGRDRVAQASARFLAEYLRAVAADPGGPGDAGDGDEPQPLDASEKSQSRGGEKKTSSSERREIVSDAELGAAWASFATEHLPACASHPSPLVRAASMAAVSGLGARATRAIARETLAETARVSLALLTAPDAPPAQRAAAARATGVVAALLAPGSESASSGPAASSEDPSPTPAHTPGVSFSPLDPPLDLVPMFDALVRACGDASKSVKLPASWAAANACAGLASAAEENRLRARRRALTSSAGEEGAAFARTSGSLPIDDAALARLARCCVDAATREGDKVRANAARALGHLARAVDFDASPARRAWLADAANALASCLAVGNAKVQWNACHACASLFLNRTARGAEANWAPLVLRMLLMLLRDARHFKIRAHAAAALAAPQTREAFGDAYADVVTVVASAAETLDAESRGAGGYGIGGITGGSDSGATTGSEHGEPSRRGSLPGASSSSPSSADPDLVKYAPQLAARLATTLLRVVALGGAGDAEALRDALTRKASVFRRALETAVAALEEARRRVDGTGDENYDALPEDPFGTRARRKSATAADGSAVDDAIIAPARALAPGSIASPEARAIEPTSPMDMSKLAEALSPGGGGGAGKKGDVAADEDGEGERGDDVRRAAAGLARMYEALGEGSDANAAFFRELATREMRF